MLLLLVGIAYCAPLFSSSYMLQVPSPLGGSWYPKGVFGRLLESNRPVAATGQYRLSTLEGALLRLPGPLTCHKRFALRSALDRRSDMTRYLFEGIRAAVPVNHLALKGSKRRFHALPTTFNWELAAQEQRGRERI